MKRCGNLFEKTFTPENMYQAYLDARQWKRMKPACHEFDIAVGARLAELHSLIHAGTYRVRPYHHFFVYEPKKREISAPWFGDIVVQHAIYRIIKPIFEKVYISASFACRANKGTHKASDYTQAALMASNTDNYTLKLDIRKFFYRIDRDILRKLIERKIKDRRMIDIMMLFADDGKNPVGIPIGNLLSQTYALIYLNKMDHFIKRTLKIEKYCRYVDDFILFDLSREICLEYKAIIEKFLKDELHLELSKWTLQKVRKGINFVGYRTWGTARFLRKFSLLKFRRAVVRGKRDIVISLLGHAKATSTLRWMEKYLQQWSDVEHGLNPVAIVRSWHRLANRTRPEEMACA